MTLTYEIKITGMKTQSDKNVVVQTYWELYGTDENGNSGKFNGATPFNFDEVNQKKMIPFAKLTEEIVGGWILEIINNDENYKAHIDSVIEREINANIVTEVKLPWDKTEDAKL
jgi:hypothetical protein